MSQNQLGKYQHEALAVLISATTALEFWEMPIGVTPDIICTLAARGLVRASITVTQKGVEALEKRIKVAAEMKARKERNAVRAAIRKRMTLSKTPNMRDAKVVRIVPKPFKPVLITAVAKQPSMQASQLAPIPKARLMGGR